MGRKKSRIADGIRQLMRENRLDVELSNRFTRQEQEIAGLGKYFIYVEFVNTAPKISYVFHVLPDLTIGRNGSNCICIQDPYISKNHMKIHKIGDFLFAQNVSESNLVTLKRGFRESYLLPGEEKEILQGDVICIGEARIRVCLYLGAETVVN